ncbi:MAG TPA: replicative DNA helicase [Nocardioidaceae bacterium]|nr:replicative DNA helicase [Nocardioidaceae bacterium]
MDRPRVSNTRSRTAVVGEESALSIAEFHGRVDEDYSQLDRTPPSDYVAEQSVLGAMLLSKDAIADVVEVVRGTDFYRPAHETVYDAIIDLYGRGEPADAVTVSAELQRQGELGRVGGAPYLHTLVSGVPIAANAGYYAEIVREKAILRRLVDAGTRIAQMGYAGEGEVDDVVDRAQAEVYGVTEKRSSEDYAPLAEIMEGALDEIEAIGNRNGEMVGVPTGFAELDELTNGLHPGQLVMIAARPAMGKALALDTPLATPTGWTSMGEVAVGDRLYGADGKATTVVAATEVMHGRPCYEISFSDGTRIVADAEHQWLTEDRETRRGRAAPTVVTTREIESTLRVGRDRRANHSVRNTTPLEGSATDLLIAPYTLGAWLGNGEAAGNRLTSDTPEIPMMIEAEGYAVRPLGNMMFSLVLPQEPESSARGSTVCPECDGRKSHVAVRCSTCHLAHSFTGHLRTLGVRGNKHIPGAYLRAPEPERRALLAGLLDTDGTIVRMGGAVQLALTNARLAADAYELIVSLGYKCGRRTKGVQGRSEATSTCHILSFSALDDVFRLHRKAVTHKEHRGESLARNGRRYITGTRQVPSVPVRCVQVDNVEHRYLAGESMVPTHNSTLALDVARAASIKHGLASVIFSLEMTRNEITMRLLSAEGRIPLHHMRNGHMSDDDWQRLARKMGEVSSAPLFIDDSPNMTMTEIRAKARRLKQRHDLRLIVVDYLQLMTSGKKVESRQLEVSEFSRQMKLLAKELEVPVVALSQLNRGAEQRSDKRPMLSDLRESGCLTADTRLTRADNGDEISLGELMTSQVRDVPVWALDDRLKLVPRTLTHAFPSGVKEVFRLRLASGREIKATSSHRFLTYDGWRSLGELAPGNRLGTIRHVPAPLRPSPMDDNEVVLLAHMLGDGSFVRRQPIRYASIDEANLTAVDGLRSHEKVVPASMFAAPNSQVRLFLRHLWATDGSVHRPKGVSWAHVSYATRSRTMADQVASLLLRFNIYARVSRVQPSDHRDMYHVKVYGAENQLRFIDKIGVHGGRGEVAREIADSLRSVRPASKLDTDPKEVWVKVKAALKGKQMTNTESAPALGRQRVGRPYAGAPTRARLAEVAAILDDDDLELQATNDVYWDKIVEIESIGTEDVYDATVLGLHNFVANGIAAHNSLEQDADMVILLHREDAYEKESLRPGEADMIVAKHRNGPTKDVVVAFQGHYSRFVDMAHG